MDRVALPLVESAPWWRPVAPDDLAGMLGVEPKAGLFELCPGWTLAVCSLARGDGVRRPRWGWVKDSFVILGEFIGEALVGNLSHLPTGALIAHVIPKEEAAVAAELIMPLADWRSLELADGLSLPVPQTLQEAGFETFFAVAEGGPVPVLMRVGTLQ